ncbi:VOC family protein [bacterium SCSIO 12643]|nr:VOC family protein [bacterium SCSIO 12643]
MRINSIDHIVLTVHDVNKTCQFYTQVLGMKEITFGEGRKALLFGSQKINLHQKGNELEPKAMHPICGSSDLCLISTNPIEEIKKELDRKQIPTIGGILNRTGAAGPIKSIYIRDPDGNLIEISNYINRSNCIRRM